MRADLAFHLHFSRAFKSFYRRSRTCLDGTLIAAETKTSTFSNRRIRRADAGRQTPSVPPLHHALFVGCKQAQPINISAGIETAGTPALRSAKGNVVSRIREEP